jgi:hypothetical protein
MSERVPQYVWRSEWIHPFESPWGIFERFKLANFATSVDVLQAFGTDEAKSHPRKRNSRDLIWLHGLDPRAVERVFGHSIHAMVESFLGRFCVPFTWGPGSTYICDHVRFCPKCVAAGFHSLFHQYRLLNSCPFHGDVLFDRCPQCRQPIPYELHYSTRIGPFSCKCGYVFYSSTRREFIEQWSSTAKLEIQNNDIRAFLNLDDQQLKRLNSLHCIPEAFIQSGIVSLRRVLNLVKRPTTAMTGEWSTDVEAPTFTAKVPAFLFNGVLDPVFPPSKLLRDSLEFHHIEFRNSWIAYEYICLYESYKAIARRLRKTILRRHRKCISDYVREAFLSRSITLCPYAVAYARWRQEMEALDTPWKVDRFRKRHKIFGLGVPFAHHLATNLMVGLSEKSFFKNLFGNESSFASEPKMWPGIIWFKLHFACRLMWTRYFDWLQYIQHNPHRAAYSLACPEVPRTYPFMILEALDNPLTPFSMHYWS